MLAARAEAAARTLLVGEEVWRWARESRADGHEASEHPGFSSSNVGSREDFAGWGRSNEVGHASGTTSKVGAAAASAAAANIAAADAFADFEDGNLVPDSTAAAPKPSNLRAGLSCLRTHYMGPRGAPCGNISQTGPNGQ